MEVTIGGNRVGSGKKMKTDLNNYGRSTHNLSDTFTSTMASGVLYPCFVKPALRGDNFEIDIDADCRTIPTTGPLFGSYKLQIDFYQCPFRLYQAILHNNPLAIGLNMNQVKLPMLKISDTNTHNTLDGGYMSNSSLLKYLGLSGIGTRSNNQLTGINRQILAIPALAYYDIFKNYYANKQEDYAYVISGVKETNKWVDLKFDRSGTDGSYQENADEVKSPILPSVENSMWDSNDSGNDITTIYTEYIDPATVGNPGEWYVRRMKVDIWRAPGMYLGTYDWNELQKISTGITSMSFDNKSVTIVFDNAGEWYITPQGSTNTFRVIGYSCNTNQHFENASSITLNKFLLSNIDDMRYDILSHHTLGAAFVIDSSHYNYAPYSYLIATNSDNSTTNRFPMNGLVLKTYQNDIFNNWLNTEWIEGANGINELSKVAIVDGTFSMDSLNFAAKLYNMLNRVAVAGGTYEDWQDVVYEEVARRSIESPVFIGGMSKEVVFDEVIQTAPGEYDGQKNALGTLGGRGRARNEQKGGHINVKCDEACFIIGIASLTPRINYNQGNEFYMTELQSLDDLHKPGMDGIGFQDLVGERLAWWDTKLTNGTSPIFSRSKVGKLPAWIDYMTSVNRVYGEFADFDAENLTTGTFMTLNRNYEYDKTTGGIKDVTTYIDPRKFNYAFAYTALDAQNFWVQISFNTTARRLMSARLIPNV